MSSQLSMPRLGWLLRADLMLRSRTVLIASGALVALIVALGIFTAIYGNPSSNIYPAWFYGMLFVGGPIAASYSFAELHDKSRNQAYLLQPASALEKTLSRLVIVTLLFVPFVFALLTVVSWLNASISLLLVGQALPMFSPSDYLSAEILGQALVLQSVFFLGAAWFRKSHFLKTSFAAPLIVIGLTAVAALILWLVNRDLVMALEPGMRDSDLVRSNLLLFNTAEAIGPVLYYVILPPFCWWVAWLRVKETQVSYGV